MANGPRKPMRQGQQNRRGRGRGRKPQNPLSRNLESNGPDVKIRGTASHIAEKYATLARDALSSGDTVAGESYLQHAEHYNRIIMANQAQQAENANANGSGAGRAQPNGSGESSENAQPEAAQTSQQDKASAPQPEPASEATASEKPAKDLGADDGLARTMARTTRSAGNGADKDSKADKADKVEGDEQKAAADKSDAEETPDEAVT